MESAKLAVDLAPEKSLASEFSCLGGLSPTGARQIIVAGLQGGV